MSAAILIVENHDNVRRALRNWLELTFSEFVVLEAINGEEAISLALSESPRLILMDITLPGINGIETARRLRTTSPTIPVVIFAIYDDEIYRAEAELAGVSAYVPKCTMRTELIPKLAEILKIPIIDETLIN